MLRETRVIALLALAALLPPAGAEPPKAPAGSSAAAAGAPKLPQNLKLDPALVARQRPRIALPGIERLDALYATFKERFNSTKAALDTRRRVTDACLARAYTQREQREAGCLPESSVQTCSELLLCWCRRDASHDYSRRRSELVEADRALKAEIGRLVDAAQKENIEVTAQLRCAN
jgi:hypothetical protein